MTCNFTAFSTVFQSYQDNGGIHERLCAMGPCLQLRRFPLEQGSNMIVMTVLKFCINSLTSKNQTTKFSSAKFSKNGSAPLHKMAAKASNRKTFKRHLHVLLGQWLDCKIISQKCSLDNPLPKLLECFRSTE